MAFARKLALVLASAIGALSSAAHAIPFVSMYVTPGTIDVGATTRLQVNIYDSSGFAISGGTIAGFTYPPGVTNAPASVVSSNCGGLITAVPGTTTLAATGLSTGAFAVCTFEVEVTAATVGVQTFTMPAGGFSGSTGSLSVATTALLAVTPPLVVTNVADAGAGSLREILTFARDICPGFAGTARVRFNIPGPGPHTIMAQSELPSVNCDNTVIDGYTQPGSQANTASDGTNNAVIKVAIDGTNCTGCNRALLFQLSGELRGVSIHSFPDAQLETTTSVGLYGNYINADPAGNSPLRASFGVRVNGSFVTIGSSAPADANLIVNTDVGVQLAASARVEGNLIGGTRGGGSGLGNGVGMLILGPTGGVQVNDNFIRYNAGPGVLVDPSATGRYTFSMNAMSGNLGPGIDLGGDGPTPNDEAAFPYDQDSGPNRLTNYPVITLIQHVGGNTYVEGYIKTEEGPGVMVDVELFLNPTPPPAGTTQGAIPIAALPTFEVDATGVHTFSHTIPGILADYISTAATIDYCGDGCIYSSEYSPAYPRVPVVPVVGPSIATVPGLVEFAPQAIGSESALQTVRVLNTGAATLLIDSITASGDFVLFLAFTSPLGPCATSLAPGASCEIQVSFRPTGAGSREGAISITSNAASGVALVRLLGTGVLASPPRALTLPASLAFDAQRVGTTSAAIPLPILNNLGADVSVTELTVTGDFSISDTCTTIAARGTCSVRVSFLPTATGPRTGSITVRVLTESTPYVVQLSGTGVPNPLPALVASISQARFDRTLVGAAVSLQVTLRNAGQVPASVTSVTPLGPFFARHSCTTLAAGETCDVTIYFMPYTVGRLVGALVVASNAEGSPLRIDLSGVGCAIPSASRFRFGGLLCGP